MSSSIAGTQAQRALDLRQLFAERIVILDGAMGTMIQQRKLDEGAFRGERFKDWPSDLKGCNDLLVLTKPALIADIHREFLAAGADLVATNTFNATSLSLADYGLEALVYELNLEAVKLEHVLHQPAALLVILDNHDSPSHSSPAVSCRENVP